MHQNIKYLSMHIPVCGAYVHTWPSEQRLNIEIGTCIRAVESCCGRTKSLAFFAYASSDLLMFVPKICCVSPGTTSSVISPPASSYTCDRTM